MSFTSLLVQTSHAAQSDASGSNALSFLVDDDSAADDFLPPDVAFKLQLNAPDGKTIDTKTMQAQFTVAPGYYLYKSRIQFSIAKTSLISQPALQITEVSLPKGELKNDPTFGEQEVYHHDFIATITLNQPVENKALTIAAIYQGCSEKGLCYAPIKKDIVVSLDTDFTTTNSFSTDESQTASDDQSTQLLKSGNIGLIIAGFFVAGLLLSLTPCVLPMIPILSSIIVGAQASQAAQSANNAPRKWQAFGLSVAYVLGMALSYTLAGIAAGLSGSLLSQSLQNPWVLGASSMVFVLLALSMFGLYELKLPQAIERIVLRSSNQQKGGRFVGVFIMGALSALIVSPCIAAPLAGALIYISQTQNVVLGGVALFALSIGMGIPLLLIGASAGKILPKAGPWMNGVKHFFGVLMISMAIWLIAPLIPTSVQCALWAALFVMLGIYLNALEPLNAALTHQDRNQAKLWKGVGLLSLLLGIALTVGALSGAKSPLQPLANLSSNTCDAAVAETTTLNFARITSIEDLNLALAQAKGKPVMLDFYADWCVACKELEKFTFSDSKVQAALNDTVLLQADLTANNADDQALLKHFGLFGPPAILFFDKNGQTIPNVKTIGYVNASQFLTLLDKRNASL